MTHPMLEKVARAISPGAWCIGYNPAHRAASLICARAAVQALLEPDEGMVEIGMDYDEREIEIATGTPPTPAQCVSGQFRAMLVSILDAE